MKSKYDNYDLFEHTDKYITRPRFEPETDNSHFWPSESSVKFYDEFGDLTVEGKCLRASYFRIIGGFTMLPLPAYTRWIFEMGELIERMLVQKWKEMGIWVDSQTKFYDAEHNVSGALDAILREPTTGIVYPAEVKSAYGYFAEKEIFGTFKEPGFPKVGNLLQLLIYLWKFKDQFPYGRLVYFFRDNTKRRTFKVELVEQGNLIYPKVEGQILKSFTVEDILERYSELKRYVDSKTVPPMDYELIYPETKIKDFRQKGKISQSKFQKWEKGKLEKWEYVGDWQCRLCAFRRVCYPNIIDAPEQDSL